MRRTYGLFSLLAVMIVVSACAETRGEYGLMKQNLPKYGFLGEYYEKLQTGDEKKGQPEYVYNAPDVETIARKATKFIVDPVVIFKDDKSQLDPRDAPTLVNYLHNDIYEAWKDGGWEIVDMPGPNTNRYGIALFFFETDAHA